MSAPVVFMDTETCGLGLDDDIWEFAAIRREVDGTERQWHFFVEHDVKKCQRLPEKFLADHTRRFPANPHGPEWAKEVVSATTAQATVTQLFDDRPHVVGAVPQFDTERIAHQWFKYGAKPKWHYHLIDVENLAVGFLAGRRKKPLLPPWNSDDLTAALGLDAVPDDERHTALGDVRWVRRMYDAVMSGQKEAQS